MLNKLNKIYFEVAPSKITGVGLIAIRDIPKGTFLFKATNPEVKYYTYKYLRDNGIPLSVIKMIKKYFANDKKGIELPIDFYDDTFLQIVFYINHSNNPNVKHIDSSNSYVTKRKIKKNEELTINYNTNDYCPECIHFDVN